MLAIDKQKVHFNCYILNLGDQINGFIRRINMVDEFTNHKKLMRTTKGKRDVLKKIQERIYAKSPSLFNQMQLMLSEKHREVTDMAFVNSWDTSLCTTLFKTFLETVDSEINDYWLVYHRGRMAAEGKNMNVFGEGPASAPLRLLQGKLKEYATHGWKDQSAEGVDFKMPRKVDSDGFNIIHCDHKLAKFSAEEYHKLMLFFM